MPRRRLTIEARRLEILRAAEICLRRHGTGVSVDDIVAEAKAAKGTFYTCFPSWDDMLVTVRDQNTLVLKQAMAPVLALIEAGAWDRVLGTFADTFITFIIDLQGLHDVLFHSAFTLARPLPPNEKPQAYIANILRQGQAAGAYAPIHADIAGVLIFALVHETADAIIAGTDRALATETLETALHRILFAKDRKPKSTKR